MNLSLCTSVCKNQNLSIFNAFIMSLKQMTYNPFELVIVDNGSGQETKDYLQKILTNNIIVVTNQENFGLGISTDQAVHCFRDAEFLFRLDSDVIFKEKNWDIKMLDTAFKSSLIGQVGTPINTAANRVDREDWIETEMVMGCCQFVKRTAILSIELLLKENKQKLLDKANDWITKDKSNVDKVKRLNLIKKWVMSGEGYWDPNFYYGVDDFEYSLLVKYVGFVCAVAPIQIEHANSSMNEDWKEIRHKNVNEGFSYFRTKWELILAALGDRNDLICKTLGSIFGNFNKDEVINR